MSGTVPYRLRLRRECGAALLEFAFVLPILLAFVVGVIYYGFVFTLASAVTHAAKQGAEVAAAIEPLGFDGPGDYKAAVRAAVQQSVEDTLDWLPPSVSENAPATVCFADEDCGSGDSGARISVTMVLSGNRSPLLPQLTLPLVGTVPPLPPALTGLAEVTL